MDSNQFNGNLTAFVQHIMRKYIKYNRRYLNEYAMFEDILGQLAPFVERVSQDRDFMEMAREYQQDILDGFMEDLEPFVYDTIYNQYTVIQNMAGNLVRIMYCDSGDFKVYDDIISDLINDIYASISDDLFRLVVGGTARRGNGAPSPQPPSR